MDEFIFWFLLFMIFVGLPVGFLLFLYFIGKKLHNKKIGIVLASAIGVLYLLGAFYLYFEDEFFTKSQARKILLSNKIVLKEDFEIINNETGGGMGDYYHHFSLNISDNDKKLLLNKFKRNSDSLKKLRVENPEYHENIYSILKENKGVNAYDREYILISKTKNILEYEIYHE